VELSGMSLPRPSPRPQDDVQKDVQQFIPLESKDTLGMGPANEMISRLAAAIAHEEDFGIIRAGEPTPTRWPLAKTLTVLVVGCGLFWLLFFLAIVALT
jgi:hypothetical protein